MSHRHDGCDEERLVAKLRHNDDRQRGNEGVDETHVNLLHRLLYWTNLGCCSMFTRLKRDQDIDDQLFSILRLKVKSGHTQSLSQDFKNVCPKQHSKGVCPSRFSYSTYIQIHIDIPTTFNSLWCQFVKKGSNLHF